MVKQRRRRGDGGRVGAGDGGGRRHGDDSNTLAFQSGNGVSYVVLFNRRLPSGPDSYVGLFMDILEDQLGDPVAARHTVAEALARRTDPASIDVLVSRGIVVGATRGSR